MEDAEAALDSQFDTLGIGREALAFRGCPESGFEYCNGWRGRKLRFARRSRGFGQWPPSPSEALLAVDAGAFAPLGGQDVGVAGVGVAPAQVGVQGSELDPAVRMVRLGGRELLRRSEVRLNRVGPEDVG
ncbi:hypothetical protein GCM10010344_00640 [Streptomyces bluensis]|nr:hypothetical protein GCM10010344_00640 [Streptomyces bluensis]